MLSCSGVRLFVEVTSPSTREVDLGSLSRRDIRGPGKPRLYGDADVPVYMIVDRKKAQVLVHSAPQAGLGHTVPTTTRIGGDVTLPGIGTVPTDFIKDLL